MTPPQIKGISMRTKTLAILEKTNKLKNILSVDSKPWLIQLYCQGNSCIQGVLSWTHEQNNVFTEKYRWLHEHLYVWIPDTLAMIQKKFLQYIETKVMNQLYLKSTDRFHTIFFPGDKYFFGFSILRLLLDCHYV